MGLSLKDLENAVHSVENAPDTIERAAETATSTTLRVIKGGLQYGGAAVDEVGGAQLEEVAGSLARGADLGIGVSLIVADLWLTFINRKWINATDRLPGPFRIIARTLTSILFPLHQAADFYVKHLYDLQRTLYHDQRTVWRWHYVNEQALIDLATAKPKPHPVAHPVTATPQVSKADIAHLQREINTLNYAIGIEQHRGGVPESVYHNIHALQADVHGIRNSISDLYNRDANVAADLHDINQRLADLTQHMHGLATVATNWQEVSDLLERHVSRLTKDYNQAESQIHANTSAIHQLAPLAVLLSAGALGLRTLRQLEDTPCMCPKFLNLPNELGTALAVVEFIENG